MRQAIPNQTGSWSLVTCPKGDLGDQSPIVELDHLDHDSCRHERVSVIETSVFKPLDGQSTADLFASSSSVREDRTGFRREVH